MITREQVERLERLDTGEHRVLTVYLNLEPSRQIQRSYRIAFEDLVREAGDPVDHVRRARLMDEVGRTRTFLDTEKPGGKGLALFSCTPAGLWEAYFLRVPTPDHLSFEPKPDLTPLLDILDEYERYAVALVDKERARLFSVFLGEIVEAEAYKDIPPARHIPTRTRQTHFQQHQDAHVHRHLKKVAERLGDWWRRQGFDRLILAGPEEASSELKRLLPAALAPRLVGVIPAEMLASDAEILEKTLAIESRIEREAEARLLAELIETAGGGGRAVSGVAPTLEALWFGEVLTLVVAEGYHQPGCECTYCGRLETGSVPTCPACGKPMRPTRDLAHRAMGQTRERSGSVEVLHGDAARRLREEGGGLGAVLRFRVAAATSHETNVR